MSPKAGRFYFQKSSNELEDSTKYLKEGTSPYAPEQQAFRGVLNIPQEKRYVRITLPEQ